MLFNKNYKSNSGVISENSLAILNKWKGVKQKIAAALQKKSEVLSAQTKRYALIIFCILFGGSSIAIIAYSVTTKTSSIKIAKISTPVHPGKQQATLQPDSYITMQEYNRVLQFETYMLHLRGDSTGRKRYDSIIKSKPHLADSVALFKKMYLSQNKK